MDNKEIIQKSIDYIEENLKSEITALELSENAGFSLFHFYKLFHKATGVPVTQYIIRRRLLYAVFEIKNGASKTDAALSYGFDTYSGFYKAFLREFSKTPDEYLKIVKITRPYKINLFKEEHIMVTHKKAKEILENWNLQNETVSDIYYEGSGVKNDSAYFVGEDFVLKFTSNFAKLQNNIELSKAIENIGLCSASPVLTLNEEVYIKENEIYFYVTKRIKGRSLSSKDFYEGDYKSKARFVGEIIGQLHQALKNADGIVNDVDLLKSVKDFALPNAKRILNLESSFCDDFIDTLSSVYEKLPKQIIHRDPNPSNILYTEDSWGFIDFELSENNIRVFDPCYAATAILSESFSDNNDKWIDVYKNIIIGYDSVAKLSEEERTAIPYIILSNQFICTAWFETQKKYPHIFETNKKMTLWLLENFEKLKDI